MRILLWIVAVPMWVLGAIYADAAAITYFRAEQYAEKNVRLKEALERRVLFVEQYRKQHGKFPEQSEFEAASKAIGSEIIAVILCRIRPTEKEGFEFPSWPEGKENYAISFWRGEWAEFYDSATKSTSLDEAASADFWRRDAIVPLGYSLIFILPPTAALAFHRRKL